jgi:hypothetical protein
MKKKEKKEEKNVRAKCFCNLTMITFRASAIVIGIVMVLIGCVRQTSGLVS